jgi:hypothetical protein
MINDEAVIERLQDAVTAYTAHADGRSDSLDALLYATPQRASHRRRVVSKAALTTGVAAAMAAIVFGATALQGPPSSSSVQPLQRSGVSHFAATHITAPTSARYPSSSYFVGRHVTKLTKKEMLDEPVIVRTSDLKVMATLPISLYDSQLTPDGTRVFGYYAGAAGHEGTENSESKNPAVKALVSRDTSGHAVYFDFSTGDVVEVGKAAWPGIVGMAIAPNGSTLAYSRVVKSNGQNFAVGEEDQPGENSIIRVIDVATSKWHEFTVKHHQTLGLALSPDATKLAFTETQTTNLLFMADLSQPNPAASARPVVPPQPCAKGGYDHPAWLDSGLYAVQECEPNARGLVDQVDRIDPKTLQPVGSPVAPLPDGGILSFEVAATGQDLSFLYMPARTTSSNEGDMRVLFRNNELWRIKSGETVGHRTGVLTAR